MMRIGDEVNGYRITTAPTNVGGGMSQWSFAEKDGRQYFVKMFLAPKYPLDSGPGSPASKERKRAACMVFEQRHLEIQRRLDPDMPGGGNLVVTRDFFRVDSTYVKVMDRIEVAHLPAAHELTPHQLIVILRTLVFSLRLLHDKHVVHGDLKPDNVLVNRGGENLFISKLIDFDEAYVAGQPPPSDQIVGDPGYYSPELLHYIKQNPRVPATALGLPSDMFSLGVLLHTFLTGEAPWFDRTTFRYPAEAVVAGSGLGVGSAPEPIRPLLAGLLSPLPATRPTIGAVVDFLTEVDPAALVPAPPASPTGSSATLTETTVRPSVAARAIDDRTALPPRVTPATAPTASPAPITSAPAASAPAEGTSELRISMGRRKRPEPT